MFLRKGACRMGKWLARVLCIVLAAACFVGCGAKDERDPGELYGEGETHNEADEAENKANGAQNRKSGMDETRSGTNAAVTPFRIVATVFPAYDWTREILGEQVGDVELTLLLDGGVDMHSYQPTADDIIRIATCDVFIYVGGESDQWVEKVLSAAVNPDMVIINLLDVLGEDVKEEERVEGMEAGHEHGAIFGQEEEAEADEHVWLSVRNAKILCAQIALELEKLDSAHAVEYEQNVTEYIARLDELDAAFQCTVREGEADTLLFADRFPFRYLTDDYGLNYFAAFPGCEAETEASFETVAFLAKKVDELNLHGILVVDGSDRKIAETVISGTEAKDQEVFVMDSMQSVTKKEAEQGMTYLSVMEENRKVLERVLAE